MSVFVEGLIGIIVFYILILVVGLYAGRKTKNNTEEAILANRKFGLFVSSMTLTGAYLCRIWVVSKQQQYDRLTVPYLWDMICIYEATFK